MAQMMDFLVNKLSSPLSVSSQITFKQGQLLTGKILEIFAGGTAAVSLRNGVVTAKLDAPLEKGKPYLFEVLAVPKGGQPVLRAAGSIQHEKDWTLFLSKMGLSPTPELGEAVSALDEHGLPITKKLTAAAAILLKLPEQNEQVNKLVLQKISELPLPISEETVIALRDALNGKHLQEEMSKLLKLVKNEAGPSFAATKTIALLESFLIPSRHTSEQTGTVTKAVISSTQPDAGVALVKQAPPLKAGEGVNNHTVRSSNSFNVQPVKDLFSAAVERMLKVSGLNHEFQSLQSLQTLHPPNTEHSDTVKKTLLNLLKDSDASLSLKTQADHVISKITGLQLLNTASAADPAQQVYLQIPLPDGYAAKQLSVIWEGKKEAGNMLDKHYCRIWLWLELQQLKEVGIDLNIQKNTAVITIYSSYKGIEHLGAAAEKELKHAMQLIGYQVSSVVFKQPPKEEKGFSWQSKMNASRSLDVKI
ncbi:hypothetical protein ACFQPF_10705 [Fictibacillus iocasae]|uniref:Flagellar hook-length control protein-like C-terminal domain-containing protein n=1 Tax=Fictibacillus iocasae TaxID=2715437 RepID=A0ABW2NNW6_9BACL